MGHAGTLDPGATGLLVILVGRATRLARFVALLPKRYVGTVRFGVETTTDDADGEPVGGRDEGWRGRTPAEVAEALATVAAQPSQVPPPVSAKKVAGERAYRRVRRGERPEMRAVPAAVYEARVSAYDASAGEAVIEVACGAGTYLRAIARDVGRALGTRAHLSALRRVAIGRWRVEQALGLDALALGDVPLQPMREAVAHLPVLDLGPDDARLLRHGRKIAATAGHDGPVAAVAAGKLIAVVELRDGCYVPLVGLAP